MDDSMHAESRESPRCGSGVRLGVEYDYFLYDHCRIEWAHFDCRLWRTRPRPSHSGNFTLGVMRLLAKDRPSSAPANSLLLSLPPRRATSHFPATDG